MEIISVPLPLANNRLATDVLFVCMASAQLMMPGAALIFSSIEGCTGSTNCSNEMGKRADVIKGHKPNVDGLECTRKTNRRKVCNTMAKSQHRMSALGHE